MKEASISLHSLMIIVESIECTFLKKNKMFLISFVSSNRLQKNKMVITWRYCDLIEVVNTSQISWINFASIIASIIKAPLATHLSRTVLPKVRIRLLWRWLEACSWRRVYRRTFEPMQLHAHHMCWTDDARRSTKRWKTVSQSSSSIWIACICTYSKATRRKRVDERKRCVFCWLKWAHEEI